MKSKHLWLPVLMTMSTGFAGCRVGTDQAETSEFDDSAPTTKVSVVTGTVQGPALLTIIARRAKTEVKKSVMVDPSTDETDLAFNLNPGNYTFEATLVEVLDIAPPVGDTPAEASDASNPADASDPADAAPGSATDAGPVTEVDAGPPIVVEPRVLYRIADVPVRVGPEDQSVVLYLNQVTPPTPSQFAQLHFTSLSAVDSNPKKTDKDEFNVGNKGTIALTATLGGFEAGSSPTVSWTSLSTDGKPCGALVPSTPTTGQVPDASQHTQTWQAPEAAVACTITVKASVGDQSTAISFGVSSSTDDTSRTQTVSSFFNMAPRVVTFASVPSQINVDALAPVKIVAAGEDDGLANTSLSYVFSLGGTTDAGAKQCAGTLSGNAKSPKAPITGNTAWFHPDASGCPVGSQALIMLAIAEQPGEETPATFKPLDSTASLTLDAVALGKNVTGKTPPAEPPAPVM